MPKLICAGRGFKVKSQPKVEAMLTKLCNLLLCWLVLLGVGVLIVCSKLVWAGVVGPMP